MEQILGKIWTIIVQADPTGKAALISLFIIGLIFAAGVFIKWKKVSLEGADTYSIIDERRFNQMNSQIKELQEELERTKKEISCCNIEKNHYRSRIRDLLFLITKIRWSYEKVSDMLKQNNIKIKWPDDRTDQELEKWALESPNDLTKTEE